jgi:hypothetical protein
MRQVFTQLACGLLLLCLTTNMSGLFVVFYFQQQELKREMRQYIRRHEQFSGITIFTFPAKHQKSLQWEIDEEYSFHGQLYDVIKKVQRGDQIFVYCIPDDKESALIKNFLQLSENKKPLKDKTSAQTELLSWPYVLAEQNMTSAFTPLVLSHHEHYSFFLPFTERVILAPPPRAVC